MSWHRDGSHCDDPIACGARTDRRQRAREAAQDVEAANHGDLMSGVHAVEAAIETAMRVQITPEVIEAFDIERNGSMDAGDIDAGLRAAFEAAGFEVEL